MGYIFKKRLKTFTRKKFKRDQSFEVSPNQRVAYFKIDQDKKETKKITDFKKRIPKKWKIFKVLKLLIQCNQKLDKTAANGVIT